MTGQTKGRQVALASLHFRAYRFWTADFIVNIQGTGASRQRTAGYSNNRTIDLFNRVPDGPPIVVIQ